MENGDGEEILEKIWAHIAVLNHEHSSKSFKEMLSPGIHVESGCIGEHLVEIAVSVSQKFIKIVVKFKFHVSFSTTTWPKTQFEGLWTQLQQTDQLLVDGCQEKCDTITWNKWVDMEIIHLWCPVFSILAD